MSDRIFLAIGIQKTYDLVELKGAIPAAKALYNWAVSQGYEADIVTDEKNPVTSQRVKVALENLLGQGAQKRIIISFAGHGFTRNGTEDLWLLSDWRDAPGAIDHAKMRQRIERYLPAQVGIISDACRSFVTNQVKHVEGTGLVKQPEYKEKSIQRAIINGTLSGSESFSTPKNNEAQFCFLTKVIYDALRGKFDWGDANNLDNDTFYDLIEKEVPRLARKYKVKQIPDPQGSFRSTPDNIWSVHSNNLATLAPLDFGPPPQPPRRKKKRGRGSKWPFLEETSEPYIGETAPTSSHIANLSSLNKDLLREGKRLDAKLNREDHTLESTDQFSLHITVSGAKIKDSFFEFNPQTVIASSFRQEQENFPYANPAPSYLLKLNNGDWCGAAFYSGFQSYYALDPQGVIALRLARDGMHAPHALQNMARASMGLSFGNAYDTAAQIRAGKHVDPVLGAIAAYSYNQIGEIDEIRRMAYFYSSEGQALPFDIAMLAQLELKNSAYGYYGVIPSIRARAPKTDIESEKDYTHQSTPKTTVLVAGRFPWLTRGWSLVDDNRNPAIRTLEPIGKHLRSSLFTTLASEGGELLVNYLKEVQS